MALVAFEKVRRILNQHKVKQFRVVCPVVARVSGGIDGDRDVALVEGAGTTGSDDEFFVRASPVQPHVRAENAEATRWVIVSWVVGVVK